MFGCICLYLVCIKYQASTIRGFRTFQLHGAMSFPSHRQHLYTQSLRPKAPVSSRSYLWKNHRLAAASGDMQWPDASEIQRNLWNPMACMLHIFSYPVNCGIYLSTDQLVSRISSIWDAPHPTTIKVKVEDSRWRSSHDFEIYLVLQNSTIFRQTNCILQ